MWKEQKSSLVPGTMQCCKACAHIVAAPFVDDVSLSSATLSNVSSTALLNCISALHSNHQFWMAFPFGILCTSLVICASKQTRGTFWCMPSTLWYDTTRDELDHSPSIISLNSSLTPSTFCLFPLLSVSSVLHCQNAPLAMILLLSSGWSWCFSF